MGSASPVLYGIVKRFFRTVQENTKTDVYKEPKQQIMLNSLNIFLREKNVPHSYQKVRFVTWQIIMQIHHWRLLMNSCTQISTICCFDFFYHMVCYLAIHGHRNKVDNFFNFFLVPFRSDFWGDLDAPITIIRQFGFYLGIVKLDYWIRNDKIIRHNEQCLLLPMTLRSVKFHCKTQNHCSIQFWDAISMRIKRRQIINFGFYLILAVPQNFLNSFK